jgi:hypothetical protein
MTTDDTTNPNPSPTPPSDSPPATSGAAPPATTTATATAPPPASGTPQPPARTEEDALFGVSLIAAAIGVLLLMIAAVLYYTVSVAEPGATFPSFFERRVWILAIGTGLSVLGIGLQANRIWELLYRRRSLFAVNALLMSVLAIALTALVDYVTYRHFHEFDWTRQGVFTISDESIQVAKNLEKNIRIWVIFPGESESELVVRLIDHYKSQSPKIEVLKLDPLLDRDKLMSAIKELGLEPRSMDDVVGVIVQSGYSEPGPGGTTVWHTDRSKRLTETDFFESSFDPQSGGRGQKKFKGEQALTNALMEVTEEKKPKLYFLQGHGELNMEGRKGGDFGECGELTKELRGKNYDVQSLNILDRPQKDIPDDASVIIVDGPSKNFDPQETGALEKYLAAGGKALIMMGAQQEWKKIGIEELLKKYNVELEEQIIFGIQNVFDPQNGEIKRQLAPGCVADTFESGSKITAPLAGMRSAFPQPRVLKALTDNPHAKATEIVKTNAKALFYAIHDPESPKEDELKAEKKSLCVMAAVEEKHEGKPGEKEKVTRLVVAGDTDFCSNYALDQGVNEPLVLNSIAWLVGQERFVKDAVKEGDYHLDMTAGLGTMYGLLACPGLPFLTILLGITVWIIRRR